MTKKRFAIVIATIFATLSLCAVAFLLCYHSEENGSQDKEQLPNNFSYIYNDILGLSLPVSNDWSVMGDGIEKDQVDYKDFDYKSYEECRKDFTKDSNYFYAINLKTDTIDSSYHINEVKDFSSEDYSKLSDEERKKNMTTFVQSMIYPPEIKIELSDSHSSDIAGNPMDYYSFHDTGNSITIEFWIGTINNHFVYLSFVTYTNVQSSCSSAAVINHITTNPNPSVSAKDESVLEYISSILHMEKFPLWIFGALLLIALLFGVKLAKRGQFFDDCISLKVSKGIQGFAALGIVLHHLVQQLNGKDLVGISFFDNIGVIFVGIFFFFSGYGLLLSYHTKENYLHSFLKKRLPILLLPFFLSSWIYILARLISGERMSVGRVLQLITTIKLPNSNSWYVIELLVLYLVFYFSFRFIKNKTISYAVNGVFSVALIITSLLLGHCNTGEDWFKGEWWFNTTLLFFVGMTYAKFRHKLLPMIKKLYWILLPAFTLAFGVLYYFTINRIQNGGYWTETETNMAYMDKFTTLSLQLPMVICFIIALLLLTMKVQFGNRFIRFIGTFTLELYLVQNLFVDYLMRISSIKNSALYILMAFVYSIAVGWALNRLCKFLMQRMRKDKPAKQPTHTLHRNKYIDSFRLIMCFLVVCIHIPFPGEIGQLVITYGKTAVPFFIVVSGYLCYRKNGNDFGSRLKKQGARLLSLTVWANLFYVLVTYIRQGSEGFASLFTDTSLYNMLFLNESPYASHLWFLGSMVFAIGIMMLLNKCKLAGKIIYAFPLLLGLYFFSWRLDGNMDHMLQYRNAIACTLAYFMAGCVLRKHEKWLKTHLKPIAMIVISSLLFAGVAVEYIICKTSAIPYYSAELLTFAIVLLCIVCKKEDVKV